MRIYINGRFLTQRVSGVQRYARELVSALDASLARSEGLRVMLGPVELLVPAEMEPGLRPDMPELEVITLRVVPGGRGHLWEQRALYHASRDGVLLSLCSSGPLRHRAHVLALHDAHIWQIPQAFSRAYRSWHKLLRPALARRARALITVSAHAARTLSYPLRLSPDRFTIVPNGADHVARWPQGGAGPERYGLSRGGYLLAVGNQSVNKNLGPLIRAHAAADPSVPPLALVGGAVPGIAHTIPGAGERVRVLGRVPDADLRQHYEHASGFVFPSLHEGFGIPPLEAMSFGIPVLSARTGAMPEVLGQAPLWFDPTQQGSMTAALNAFGLMGAEERARRGDLGRRQAARYRWEGSAGQLATLLAGVVHPLGSEPRERDIEGAGDLIALRRKLSDPLT